MDISIPSHNFLIVDMVVLLFLPFIILLNVDCVIPLIIASLFIVISFCLHSSIILNLTASHINIKFTSKLL